MSSCCTGWLRTQKDKTLQMRTMVGQQDTCGPTLKVMLKADSDAYSKELGQILNMIRLHTASIKHPSPRLMMSPSRDTDTPTKRMKYTEREREIKSSIHCLFSACGCLEAGGWIPDLLRFAFGFCPNSKNKSQNQTQSTQNKIISKQVQARFRSALKIPQKLPRQ